MKLEVIIVDKEGCEHGVYISLTDDMESNTKKIDAIIEASKREIESIIKEK